MRYALWNVTDWRRNCGFLTQLVHRGAEAGVFGGSGEDRENPRTILHEARARHVEEVMDILRERPEGLYKRPLTDPWLAACRRLVARLLIPRPHQR